MSRRESTGDAEREAMGKATAPMMERRAEPSDYQRGWQGGFEAGRADERAKVSEADLSQIRQAADDERRAATARLETLRDAVVDAAKSWRGRKRAYRDLDRAVTALIEEEIRQLVR
jgi:hypothetical protein